MPTHPTILLTAAVTPDPQIAVKVAQPAERLEQYRRSFAFWARLSHTAGFRLCVIESTGADLSLFEDCFSSLERDSWHFIETIPPTAISTKGKGAVEAHMIDTAIDSIGGSDRVDAVYKVTGRLVVRNADSCLTNLPSRSVVARGLINRSRFDVRCIGASVDVWKDSLNGMWREVDESNGIDLGNVVAARLALGTLNRTLELHRFPERPRIRGRSATRGVRYGSVPRVAAERLLGPVDAALATFAGRKSV